MSTSNNLKTRRRFAASAKDELVFEYYYKGLTRKEAAERSNVHPSQLDKWITIYNKKAQYAIMHPELDDTESRILRIRQRLISLAESRRESSKEEKELQAELAALVAIDENRHRKSIRRHKFAESADADKSLTADKKAKKA